MGEAKKTALRVDFDCRLKLEAKETSSRVGPSAIWTFSK